jgi:hypothetical protein
MHAMRLGNSGKKQCEDLMRLKYTGYKTQFVNVCEGVASPGIEVIELPSMPRSFVA